jgi:hypothetical protein
MRTVLTGLRGRPGVAAAALLAAVLGAGGPPAGSQPGAAAPAERRLALVIGNGAYPTSALRNPVNDVQGMARALADVGFEVQAHENAGRRVMRRAIGDFGDRLRSGGVGLFYFAGHGVQVAGRNYLIPTDAEIQGERDIEIEGVDVGTVLGRMEAARNRMNIVILDACRDNPYASRFRVPVRGLASIDAPSGTIIAYATAPGRVAADGSGPNGVYTGELLRVIRQPGLRLEDVFKRVRVAVQETTRGEQIPWESSSLVGDFMFVSGSTPTTPDSPRPALRARVVPRVGSALVRSPEDHVEIMLGTGQALGQAGPDGDLLVENLPAGSQRFVAMSRASGTKVWEGEARIAPDQQTEVVVSTAPRPADPPGRSEPGEQAARVSPSSMSRPPSAVHPLAGTWRGTTTIVFGTRVNLDVTLVLHGTPSNPSAVVTFEGPIPPSYGPGLGSPTEFRERPASEVRVSERALAVRAPGSSAVLHVDLDVSPDHTTMAGWYTYGPSSGRLQLTRQPGERR